MKKYTFVLFLFGLAISLVAAGCSSNSSDPTSPTTGGQARVMAIHASPNAPGVDLYVDGSKVDSNLTFPNNTPYLSVNSGTRAIAVKVAGTSTTVLSANLPIAGNTYYSVFAIDSVADLHALVLIDTLTAPAAGKAHLRFIHLSPNAPAVDITDTTGAVIIANKSFMDYTSFIPLDAGTYNLQVRIAGTSTIVLRLSGIMLTEGKIYTVFAKGFVGGAGGQALGAQIIVNK